MDTKDPKYVSFVQMVCNEYGASPDDVEHHVKSMYRIEHDRLNEYNLRIVGAHLCRVGCPKDNEEPALHNVIDKISSWQYTSVHCLYKQYDNIPDYTPESTYHYFIDLRKEEHEREKEKGKQVDPTFQKGKIVIDTNTGRVMIITKHYTEDEQRSKHTLFDGVVLDYSVKDAHTFYGIGLGDRDFRGVKIDLARYEAEDCVPIEEAKPDFDVKNSHINLKYGNGNITPRGTIGYQDFVISKAGQVVLVMNVIRNREDKTFEGVVVEGKGLKRGDVRKFPLKSYTLLREPLRLSN